VHSKVGKVDTRDDKGEDVGEGEEEMSFYSVDGPIGKMGTLLVVASEW
jgi:hypothetical protein